MGKGDNAWTSGFEGPWTTNPVVFDNSYFTELLNNQWESHKGPGGHFQWKTVGTSPRAPDAANASKTQVQIFPGLLISLSFLVQPPCNFFPKEIMMLTSDVSLINDTKFKKFVQQFANSTCVFSWF